MKNNKGYTLVELLLAVAILAIVMIQVFNIIFSSTRLYTKGSQEITLQTDAQQVIKLFEELAMDCDGSVSYDGSNTISINNNAVYHSSYDIVLDPSHNLYLKVKENGSGNVLSYELMAENVASIALDTSNYADGSKVIFKVKMDDNLYTYESAKDIYLRNHIGSNDTGDGSGTTQDSSINDVDSIIYDMEILRYKTYDLAAEVPEVYQTEYGLGAQYRCVVENPNYDASIATSEKYIAASALDNTWYDLTDYGSKIACNGYKNKEANGTGSSYVLFQNIACPKFIIRCYTKPILFGTKVTKTVTGGITNSEVTSTTQTVATITFETQTAPRTPLYIYAQGISLADCQEISISPIVRMSVEGLKEYDSEYKYFQIRAKQNTVLTPYSEDCVSANIAIEKCYTDQDVSVQYGDTLTGTPATGITTSKLSAWPDTIDFYAGKGYDGDVPMMIEDGKSVVDHAQIVSNLTGHGNDTWFENSRLGYLTISWQNKDGYGDGIYIDKDENAVAFMTKLYEFRGSEGGYIANTSKFYEAGGEVFFDFNIKFNDGTTYSCKVIPEPVSAENNAGSWTEEGTDAFIDSMTTGRSTNVEKSTEEGHIGEPVFKTSSSTK